MEFLSSTRKVVVPRCETCNGKFRPKEKVFCIDCDKKIHYNCAVYDDEDERYMLCIDCFRSNKIAKALYRDGIIDEEPTIKVVGDDLCRVYIGRNFLVNDEEKKKIKIEGSCEHELECEIINDDDDSSCPYCGWRSEFPSSHIEHGNFKCQYITDKYKLKLDDEGDLVWEEKMLDICGRHLGDGEYCDEIACVNYEYCSDCMHQELGMY